MYARPVVGAAVVNPAAHSPEECDVAVRKKMKREWEWESEVERWESGSRVPIGAARSAARPHLADFPHPPPGDPKTTKIRRKSIKFRDAFFFAFPSLFGTKTGPESEKKSRKFPMEFCIAFCMDFRGSRPPFRLPFPSRNRARRRSGAKPRTLDFEQPSLRNHGFSPWSLPARAQNHHEKPSQKPNRFSRDFPTQTSSKSLPKWSPKGTKNV